MAKNFSIVVKVCEVILKYSIYALVALLPVLFLPWTSDALDFNKQAPLVLIGFLALFSWIVKVMVSGSFKANFNKTHAAVLLLLLVYLFSTVFSLDKYGSFWGWPRATSESLLSLICLAIFYFLVSTAFSKKEILNSIIIFFCSALLAALVGVLQLFGLFIPLSISKIASFNTVGMVGSLGVFIAVLLPLLIIMEMRFSGWRKIVFGIGLVLSIIALVLINYSVVWWVVLAGTSLVVLFGALKRDFFDLRWLVLPIFFLVVALFFIVLRPQISTMPRPVEVYLNQTVSLDIGLKTLKDRPILGSGPGTFIYDFSKYRKIDFNQGTLWNLRFDSAGSKILNVLATTGILGMLSFLLLIAAVLFQGVKFMLNEKKPVSAKSSDGVAGDNNFWFLISLGLLIAFITQVAGFFLYSSNLSLDFTFFFLIACFMGLIDEKRKERQLAPSSLLTLGVTFLFTLFFIFGLGLLILEGQRYIAEVNYFKGEVAFSSGDKEKSIKSMETAVKMNPNADIYLTELSQMYLSKLGDQIGRKDLSQEDKSKMVQLLINNSINAVKIATDISPNNVSNWSIRGFIYQNFIGSGVNGADEWAIKSYDQASALEPVNPYYPTQKGIVYMAKAGLLGSDKQDEKNQDLGLAKEQFDKAVSLKSDYAPARFQIAMVYQAQGKTDEEFKALEETKKYSPDDVGLAFQIGLLYYQKQDYQNAQKEFERTVSLNPSYANALYFLGLTYNQLGQNDKAIAAIQKVADLNPDNAEIKKVLDNLKAGKNPLDGIGQQNPPQAPVKETPPEKPKK